MVKHYALILLTLALPCFGEGARDIFVRGVSLEPVDVAGRHFVEPRLVGNTPHAGVLYRLGFPRLPAIRFRIEGEGAVDVEVDPTEEHIVPSAPLVPSVASVPRVPGARLELPPEPPRMNGRYPERSYEVDEVGTRGGTRVRIVSLYPLRLDGPSGELILNRRFRVTRRAPTPKRSPFRREAMAFVVASDLVASPSLARYLALQRELGYDVRRIDLEPAETHPTAIRARLRALEAELKHALRYVVLVGDNTRVPGYPTPRLDGVTDHFYRVLDQADYERDLGTPDVSLGRLSARNEHELSAMIDKSTRYLEGDFSDESWLSRASLAASNDPEWYRAAEATMDYLLTRFTRPFHYAGSFPEPDNAGGDELFAVRYDASGEDLLDAIREGRGFVTYGGHGTTTEWAGPEVTSEEIASLETAEATPFVTSHACYTGHFVDDSFAEEWERNPHGSVAIWASMDADFWGEGDELQRLVYDEAFGGPHAFGEIVDSAIGRFWTRYQGAGHSRYYWEDYDLFGDPSLLFRTGPTRAIHATQRGLGLYITDDDGRAVAGARVAYVGEEGPGLIATTDAKGRARVPEGSWDVAVTAANARLLRTEAER